MTGKNMQQLNVLSINVYQATEIKDENKSFLLSSSKQSSSNDFSQLIDEHLAENGSLSEKKQSSEKQTNPDSETATHVENKTEQSHNNKPPEPISEQELTEQELSNSAPINEIADNVENKTKQSHNNELSEPISEQELSNNAPINEIADDVEKQQQVASLGNNGQVIAVDAKIEQIDLLAAEQLMAFFTKVDTTPTHLRANEELTTFSDLDVAQEQKHLSSITKESAVKLKNAIDGLSSTVISLSKKQNMANKVAIDDSEISLTLTNMLTEGKDVKGLIKSSAESIVNQKSKLISVAADEITTNKTQNKPLKDQTLITQLQDQQSSEILKATIQTTNVQAKPTQSTAVIITNEQNNKEQLFNNNNKELTEKQIIDLQANKENLTGQIQPKETSQFDVKVEQDQKKFATNTDFINVTGKATQAAKDFAEQSSINILNPSVNMDAIQSQKSNIQLHQETIAIFRKDFTEAVKDKIMLMISQKLQQFDITLDPPELGNMQVRVNLQGEQAVVNFMVQNQQAKEALEQNMHKLRDMLAEQGVDVGDANVEQQSQQENDNNTAEKKHNGRTVNTVDASDAVEHSLSAQLLENSSATVDYYV